MSIVGRYNSTLSRKISRGLHSLRKLIAYVSALLGLVRHIPLHLPTFENTMQAIFQTRSKDNGALWDFAGGSAFSVTFFLNQVWRPLSQPEIAKPEQLTRKSINEVFEV